MHTWHLKITFCTEAPFKTLIGKTLSPKLEFDPQLLKERKRNMHTEDTPLYIRQHHSCTKRAAKLVAFFLQLQLNGWWYGTDALKIYWRSIPSFNSMQSSFIFIKAVAGLIDYSINTFTLTKKRSKEWGQHQVKKKLDCITEWLRELKVYGVKNE